MTPDKGGTLKTQVRSGIGILPMHHSTHPLEADATNVEF